MTRSYRFGDFRLDPATRELHRGDAPVAVPPRAFDCIVYLVEHRERAVGRDELIAAVWGRTEIGDGMLGQTVLSARRALEDTGKEQHVIRTVFRFGYHWVAPVEVVEARQDEADAMPAPVPAEEPAPPPAEAPAPAAVAAKSAAVPTAPPARRASRRLSFALAAVALLGLLAVLAWRLREQASPASASGMQARGTIALVMPVTVTAGSGFDWVRLGLMDLIGARLRAAGLSVVPSDNVVALTGRAAANGNPADAPALSHATGANLVIDARAEAIGGRWRITLRTAYGRAPALQAVGESTDVLAAARIAADQLARQLGYTPAPDPAPDSERPALAELSQQIEAAILTDRLDSARALIAGATPAERALPELRLRLAQIDYQAGDLDAAAAGFGAVAEQVSAEQDPVLHGRALSSLGVIAAVRENAPLAKRHFDDAIALLRAARAPDALGKALLGRANIAGSAGHYETALEDFAEARVAFQSAGNLLALAVLDSNLATLDLHRLRYAEAEPVFERAADRFATFGMHAAELNALTAAAEMKLALLEPDAALAMEPHLRELVAQVSDPSRQRAGELTGAQILIANGRLAQAEQDLRNTLAAAERAQDRRSLGRGHALAAQLALARGLMEQAASEAEAALGHFNTSDDVREYALTARLQVAALLAAGRTADAAKGFDVLSNVAERGDNAAARVYFHLASAERSAAAGGEAGSVYKQALAEADALRIPLDLRDVVRAYADWLVRSGDLARAGAIAERVSGWAARDYDSALLQLRIQHALGDANLWRGALARARALAGERRIPDDFARLPAAP
jgi:DNA-binding winged helix-turn-helix (wHTH) protein